MDFASKGAKQTGAVFDLVACPFVLHSHVWRHAYTTQASLYAQSRSPGEWQEPALALGGSACVDVDFASVRRLLFYAVNQPFSFSLH